MVKDIDNKLSHIMPGRTLYFTVVTKSYLPHGRSLGTHIKKVAPDADFLLFLADDSEGYFEPAKENFRCITLGSYLSVEEQFILTFGYNLLELCNALKAYAHRYVLEHTTATTWIYLDSDLLLIKPLEPFDSDSLHEVIAVTPHITRLNPDSASLVSEKRLLNYGVFNGGFLAVRRSETSKNFIKWFVSRLREACLDQPPFLYVDQLWLNLLVSVNSVKIWRDPGANVAYWNLQERQIRYTEDREWLVNDSPLLFVHFSNWDSQRLDIVSKFDPQQLATSEWIKLAELFRSGLMEHGADICQRWPYSFKRFTDGSEIKPYHRRAWLKLPADERVEIGNPFHAFRYFNRDLLLQKLRHGFRREVRKRLGMSDASI